MLKDNLALQLLKSSFVEERRKDQKLQQKKQINKNKSQNKNPHKTPNKNPKEQLKDQASNQKLATKTSSLNSQDKTGKQSPHFKADTSRSKSWKQDQSTLVSSGIPKVNLESKSHDSTDLSLNQASDTAKSPSERYQTEKSQSKISPADSTSVLDLAKSNNRANFPDKSSEQQPQFRINPCDEFAFIDRTGLEEFFIKEPVEHYSGKVSVNGQIATVELKNRFYYIPHQVASALLPGMTVNFKLYRGPKGFITDVKSIEDEEMQLVATVASTNPLTVTLEKWFPKTYPVIIPAELEGKFTLEESTEDELVDQGVIPESGDVNVELTVVAQGQNLENSENTDNNQNSDNEKKSDNEKNSDDSMSSKASESTTTPLNPFLLDNSIKVGDLVLIKVRDIKARFYDISKNLELVLVDKVSSTNDPFKLWYENLAKEGLEFKPAEVTVEVKPEDLPVIDQPKLDLTAIPFFSVDKDSTLDIDDLIYIETLDPNREVKAEFKVTELQDKLGWIYFPLPVHEDKGYGFGKLAGIDYHQQDKMIDVNQVKAYQYQQHTNPQNGEAKSLTEFSVLDVVDLTVPQGTKFIIAVGIADPTRTLSPDTACVKHAVKQLTSYYLPGMVFHMFPENITADYLSLNHNMVRPAIVSFIYINEYGETIGCEVKSAQVKNSCRLNYNNSSDFLDGVTSDVADVPESQQEFVQKQLLTLQAYQTQKQITRQYTNRVLLTDYSQVSLEVDPITAEFIGFQEIGDRSSNHIVSECMISTNLALAELCQAKDIPAIYIIQNGVKTNNLFYFLEYVKYCASFPELRQLRSYIYKPAEELSFEDVGEIRSILATHDTIKGRRLNRYLVTSSFSKCPGNHTSLFAYKYLNATSPIRRYTDYVNQYNIRSYLDGEQPIQIEDELIEALNASRQAIRKAQAKITNQISLDYFTENLHKIYVGTVTNVNKNLLQFILDGYGVTANVNLSNIQHQGYKTKAQINNITLEINNKVLELGDKVELYVNEIKGDQIFAEFANLEELLKSN